MRNIIQYSHLHPPTQASACARGLNAKRKMEEASHQTRSKTKGNPRMEPIVKGKRFPIFHQPETRYGCRRNLHTQATFWGFFGHVMWPWIYGFRFRTWEVFFLPAQNGQSSAHLPFLITALPWNTCLSFCLTKDFLRLNVVVVHPCQHGAQEKLTHLTLMAEILHQGSTKLLDPIWWKITN